MRFAQNIIMFA